MDALVEGEELGVNKKQDKWVLERIKNEEDFEISQPELHITRNERNPAGYVISIELKDDTHSIRITTEQMKFMVKHVIDSLY